MTDETDGQQPEPAENDEPVNLDAEAEDQSEAATDDPGDDAPAHDDEPSGKPGVQKRIDQLVRRGHEKEREADHWRSLYEQAQPVQQPADDKEPKREDFQDYDDFVIATAEHRALKKFRAELNDNQQRQSEGRRNREFQALKADFDVRANGQYPDYAAVVSNNPNLSITQEMAEVLFSSEQGPDIAYYLGKNPDVSHRIAVLPSHLQAAELVRIEQHLAAPAPQRQPPPPPPKTIEGMKSGHTRDPTKMSFTEYKAAREAGKI